MVIKFTNVVQIEDTMIFDKVYEESLQMEWETKVKLAALHTCLASWMYVDDKLAGEMYGVSVPDLLKHEFPQGSKEKLSASDKAFLKDVAPYGAATLYRYSTTILPEYQNKGLGKLLIAYWMGQAAGKNYNYCIGHCTTEVIEKVNKSFGAIFKSKEHKKWYGSNRTAKFYEIALS